MCTSIADTIAPSNLLMSVVPDTSRYERTDHSVGPRPHLPVTDKLSSGSDYTITATLLLAYGEMLRVPWGEDQ